MEERGKNISDFVVSCLLCVRCQTSVILSPPASPRAISHCSFFSNSPFWHGIRNAHSSTSKVAQTRGTRKNALRTPFFILFSSASIPRTPSPAPPSDPGPPLSSPALSRPESLWLQYCEPFMSSMACLDLLGSLSLHSSSSSSSSSWASSSAPTSLPDLLPRSLEEPEPRQPSLPRPFLG